MSKLKLGEILVKNHLITSNQCAEALKMQHVHPNTPLGQILCRLGYLNEDDLRFTLDCNNKRQKLSSILLKEKQIDEARLATALALCDMERIALDKALLKLRLIDENQLARAIANKYDLPYVELESQTFPSGLDRLVNVSYAQRNKLVPIEADHQSVTIAMAYPLKREDLAYIENFVKLRVRPVIAAENAILISQQIIYKLSKQIKSVETLNFGISE